MKFARALLTVAAAAALAACEPPEKNDDVPEEKPLHTNRLAKEKSPYLLQHAHNPVDWYPWGDEAFEKAKKEDKPVLLSVGYSTCHWCHVMERESFENEDIAKILNEHFVSIKVDREERPDVDEIYMEAVQAMNQGQGGWPMSVFLTPERKPFFAGTYFPPEDKFGRPGFPSLLKRLAELWKTQRADIEKQGQILVDYLKEGAETKEGELSQKLLDGAVRQALARHDAEWGGFGGAPKFPPAMTLGLLLRIAPGDKAVLAVVTKTLEAMARGGMYDQVGGGFARYSTDEQWLIPHFEKMLYDNAQLARVYAEAFLVTGDAYYGRIARETLDYVLREMTAPAGAFWSATDADSEGVEGKFFVWTPEQVAGVLGKDEGAAFCEYFGVTKDGNFEHGWSALHVPVYDEAKEKRFQPAKAKLYEARKKRIPPHLDDKILVSWNALMISAFANAFVLLEDPRYLDAAVRAANFLLKSCVVDGRLMRGYRGGVMPVKGFLDDHAWFAAALLDLYTVTGDLFWFRNARKIADDMVKLFADDAGGFFATGSDQEQLIARRKDPYDGATPSGISVAAMVLLRLAEFTADEAPRERAVKTLSAYVERMEKIALAQPEMLKAVAFHLSKPRAAVVSGKFGEAGCQALVRTALRSWPPHHVVAYALGNEKEAETIPILEGRAPKEKPQAYVCEGTTCQAPVGTPEELQKLLKR